MFNPLIRAPVTEEALEQVKQFITSGNVKVGEKLPTETQLSSMLGVSRNTVREVFITLQAQGFIEVRRGKGAFVVDTTNVYERAFIEWFQKNEFKIQQLLEVRMTLEPYSAYLAAQKITDEEIKELENLSNDYERLIQIGANIEDIVAGDEIFHLKIIKASRNELLEFFYTNVNPALNDYRMKVFSPPSNPSASIDAHNRIVEALRERDSSKTYKAMMNHIEGAKSDIHGVAAKIAISLDQQK
ncbi:hypothetical protein CVD28_18990 [Bacillus sp. M6-12]|uniref:FadR/GntR family transcriptional regulator n=1 Tax=Bacillus sp. M6-12 TaxID=2054166 RepID=UPI000C77CD21|nr:FadR/GntR family transcriptional regulator [Bacillus sp. M6-12]PLS16127.1 hypothetical protein CVD28_18990 [Bacillus sp. M6-12]